MKRLYDFCIRLLIAAFGCMVVLSACAELERRDAAYLAEMQKKHRAEELERIYGELDANGRMMTGYDLIAKGK